MALILVHRLNTSPPLSSSEVLLGLLFANNAGRVLILDNQLVIPEAPFDISFGDRFIDYLIFFIACIMTTEGAMVTTAVIIPGCVQIIVILKAVAMATFVFIIMMPVGAATVAVVANIRPVDDKTLLVAWFHFMNKFVEV